MTVQTLAETNTTVPEQPIFELIEVEQGAPSLAAKR